MMGIVTILLVDVLPYLALAAASIMLVEYWILRPARVRTVKGVVVSYSCQVGNASDMYAEQFRFNTGELEMFVTSDCFQPNKKYQIGQSVVVEYEPLCESQAKIRTLGKYAFSLIFFSLSTLATLIAISQFGLSSLGVAVFFTALTWLVIPILSSIL